LHKLWRVVRANFVWYAAREDDPLHDCLAHAFHFPVWEKFQHGLTREQIHHDQNFAIVHAVEIYPVSLSRQKQFLLRSWVEIQIQLLPPSAGFDARLAQAVQTASMVESIPGQ
jgi:hypothetical protein